MIKVLLADDHKIMLFGLRVCLQEMSGKGVSVAGIANSFNEIRKVYDETSADVLVVDIECQHQNRQSGLDFCRELLSEKQGHKVVIFSQCDDWSAVQSAYKMGVLAYVRKDESEEILLSAIKSAANNKKYYSPEIAQVLAKNSSVLSPLVLPERQLRVFLLLADGVSRESIAQELDVSQKTISNLVNELKEKLGLSTNADFTKLAIKYGMINSEVTTRV